MKDKVSQQKIDLDQFFSIRGKVLSMWPTGKEVDLEEAISYQRRLPENKSFHKVVERLHEEGKTRVFPRAGTPVIEDEIELNRALVEAGVPLIPVTTDSYTRLCQYEKAQHALEETIRTGRPKLNGYPIVNHGVHKTRRMTESCEAPLNPRFANLDCRLIAEIALASGMTGILADPFLTFGNYEKTATIGDCIANYQYIYRLIGYYTDNGAMITIDLDSWLAHGPFPNSISLITAIMAALIAAEQGVKSIVPWSNCEGNMMQDIAYARLTKRMVKEYLDHFGFKDVMVPGLFVAQIPIFPCPQETGYSFGYLTYTAMVAALAEAEAVSVRTIDEAHGIATKEAHAMSYRAAHWIFNVVRKQRIKLQSEQIEIEEKMAEMEVRAIFNRILELGNGDIVVGFVRAVDAGVVDSPMSANINVKSQVLGIRDHEGAVRYLDFGNLPIPEEAKKFHREKVREREQVEQRKMDYNVFIEDFWALSKGEIVGVKKPVKF